MAFQQYAIAAGHNVALGSLVNTDTVFGLGMLLSAQVKGRGTFNPGERRTRGNARDFFEGYASLVWMLDVKIYSVLDNLRANYCNGAWDGPVTIYTTLGGVSYFRRNAIMKLTPPNEVDGMFQAMKQYPIRMIQLAVPS